MTKKMEHTRIIAEKLSIDEEIVSNIMKSSEFIHLINNCYSINNENDLFNPILKIFENKRAIDISEA
jgi:hypothetical protein